MSPYSSTGIKWLLEFCFILPPIRLRSLIRIIMIVLVPLSAFSLLLLYIQNISGLAMADYTRDIAVTFKKISTTADPAYDGINVFLGIYSMLGVLCWTLALGIQLTGAAVITGQRTRNFLRYFALLTALLLLDDLFMIHEYQLPLWLGFDINTHKIWFYVAEATLFGVYGIILLNGIIRFRESVKQTNHRVFRLAVIFFGLSIIFDMLPLSLGNIDLDYLFEDYLKIAGILTYGLYFLGSVRQQVRIFG